MVRFLRINKDILLPISNSDINTTVKRSFFYNKTSWWRPNVCPKVSFKTCSTVIFTHGLIKIFIQCVRISCLTACCLCSISHAIERTSTVPKSKNAEINIKKLEAVLKNKHVIIVALWTVAFCNNFYTLPITLFNLSSVVEVYLGPSLISVLELSCKNS